MDELRDKARAAITALITPDDINRARRVERGLDNQGNPVLDRRRHFELLSPDGSIWVIRIGNDGVLTTKKRV